MSGRKTLAEGIGFGLIGLGHHGTRYARHLAADIPGVRLQAVCRRATAAGRALAGELGAQYYGDYRDLLRDPEVAAVVICSPTDSHREMAIAAAEHGKTVLLEKPIAADLSGADDILRAFRTHGVRLMVAQTLRYEPLAEGFREFLARVGRVRTLNLQHRSGDIRLSQDAAESPDTHSGVLLDTGVHYFDLLGWLFPGRFDSVWCQTRCHGRKHSEDAFVAVLSGADLQATVDVCRATPARHETWVAAGEAGVLAGNRFTHELRLIQPDGSENLPLPKACPTLPRVLRSFVRSITSGEPFDVPGEPARDAVAIVEACSKSARTGMPVPLEAGSSEF